MENDFRNSQYFNELPVYMQESIMQSGITFKNEKEIQKFIETLNKGKKSDNFTGFETM